MGSEVCGQSILNILIHKENGMGCYRSVCLIHWGPHIGAILTFRKRIPFRVQPGFSNVG